MTVFRRGNYDAYHFVFNGEHIQKSTHQSNLRVAAKMEGSKLFSSKRRAWMYVSSPHRGHSLVVFSQR
jgi:hypothetical protein